MRHDWKDNSPSYFRRIKLVFTYGPYLNASLAFLFMSLGVTVRFCKIFVFMLLFVCLEECYYDAVDVC